jgi:O-antigen/teichoic acid export membrane protein
LAQSLAALSGIFALWMLDKPEFAILTLMFGATVLFNTLTDLGSGAALNSLGGPIVHETEAYYGLLTSIYRLRLKFGTFALTILCPIFALIILDIGITYDNLLILFVIFVLSSIISLDVTMARSSELLNGSYRQIQKIDLYAAVVRLILTAVFIWVSTTAIAVLSAILATSVLQAMMLHRTRVPSWKRKQPRCNKTDLAIWAIIRKLTPNSIFFAFQGQIGLLILSSLGTASKVSDLGALARLSFLSVVVTTVSSNVIAPRFARANLTGRLSTDYLLIQTASLALPFLLLLLAYVNPLSLLWLLGPKYQHLVDEIMLAIAVIAISTLAGTMLSLNLSRGWSHFYSSLYIPLSICCFGLTAVTINAATVSGAILLGASGPCAIILTCAGDAFRALRKIPSKQSGARQR